MAGPHYRRVDAPQASASPHDLDRPFTFRSALPDVSVDTRRRSYAGAEVSPLSGTTTFKDSPESPGYVRPYHDYSASPISPPKPRSAFRTGRTEESPDPYSQGRQTTNDTTQSGASSRFAKTREGLSKVAISGVASPWQHGISKDGLSPTSHTVREFDPRRQRRRLFFKSAFQWFLTLFLCGALAACLIGFQSLPYMSLLQKHAFNALIVLFSLLLGQNLSSSLREYAQMLRWRLMAVKYRPLQEFELLMQCDSQRKVLKLFWTARRRGQIWPNRTQWLCATWISINLLLQILVALLGLTYNLDTSAVMQENYGQVSVCDLSVIRDVWGAENPTFYAQLGSANAYGIQGQDYSFVDTPPTNDISTPTIYIDTDETNVEYIFQDRNINSPDVTLVTRRTINTTATCKQLRVIEGGYGNATNITYLDGTQRIELDVVRVGPGAITYISSINSTCGPRCTQVMALQSAGNTYVSEPAFFKCNNTVSRVTGIPKYVQPGQTDSLYQMPDEQARIMAGAIGWSGFNFTPGDQYQYVRYSLESWWSPNQPADTGIVARRIMEFSIEGIAAMDYNGPRRNVTGWYPVTAQIVTVQWRWAAAILGVIPFIQLLALCCIIAWANQAIIKDTSCLSTARLLRPVVERLGPRGCLLTGEEIAEELKGLKVMYGWREPGLLVEGSEMVRHVDVLEEKEGLGRQGKMPSGRYDGWRMEDNDGEIRRRRRKRKRFSRRLLD